MKCFVYFQHVNDLSMQIELQYILSKAEGIYHQVIASSQLTDPIKNILGMEPLQAAVSDSSDDEDLCLPSGSTGTSDNNIRKDSLKKTDSVVTSTNGISLQADKDEVSYQKSIDFNYL